MTAAVTLLTPKLDAATVQAVVAYRIALRTLDEHEASFVDVSPVSREQHEERRVQLRAAVTYAHAAHAENSKCGSRFYGPGSEHAEDSFAQPWAFLHTTGNLWLNPPFARIEPWAKKCAEEAPKRHGLILMLTPASVGANWFQEHVLGKAFVLALAPRLSFDGVAPFPKDCSLAVYGYGLHGFDSWRWDEAAHG